MSIETHPQGIRDSIDDRANSRSAGALLELLTSSSGRDLAILICDAEIYQFTFQQRTILLPILWRYILDHRDSDNHEEAVAVGSAIRKFIAMMDVGQIGDVAILLERGHRTTLSLDIELEVAKMVFRKFEANPPKAMDFQSYLAQQLLEIAQAYMNPRVLPHDKHATVAALAIQALVAMRSQSAETALQAAMSSPHVWFAEMVSDGVAALRERWTARNAQASDWCSDLLNRVAQINGGEANARVAPQ